MKFEVRYDDNFGGNDFTQFFDTEEEAENFIEEDFQATKEMFEGEGLDYHYADFGTNTEIWEIGGDRYASWERCNFWKE